MILHKTKKCTRQSNQIQFFATRYGSSTRFKEIGTVGKQDMTIIINVVLDKQPVVGMIHWTLDDQRLLLSAKPTRLNYRQKEFLLSTDHRTYVVTVLCRVLYKFCTDKLTPSEIFSILVRDIHDRHV